MSTTLAGLTVIVTRPARQAEAVIARLASLHASVVAFPVLAIEPLLLTARDRERLRPDAYDWTVYTSANAVEQSLLQLPRPVRTRIAAIGNATARTLRANGLEVNAVPAKRVDSEGLLALPEFASVAGLRCLVLRGVGGRGTLRQTLAARGATVETGELYRRVRVKPNPASLTELRAALGAERRVIAVLSIETLDALLAVAPRDLHDRLLRTPLLVPGERVASAARQHGWSGSLLAAASAEDAAMVDALAAWHSQGTHGAA